ncbi:hypothetical protein PHMEG_00012293 [Phytophthora megakarya]|uniref:Uncharacterized protein n=1 Tax=Phytophthora megakarya TaxID=4795 RepID=A0A225WAT8_9STRA|nr:hypothetical protein PHMEG_00012293 [Phytophthora megakarya]
MAENLTGLRGEAMPDFQELLISMKQLQQRFDRHEADAPLEDLLRKKCAAMPEGTAVATIPLILDSSNFFRGPLRDRGFGATDTGREDGLRLLVRTEALEKVMVGEEVQILGRKFRVSLGSPLFKYSYVDIIGLNTSDEASNVLSSLSSCGAIPLYF